MNFLRKKIVKFHQQERYEHDVLPWIESPFNGVDLNKISFHQRHEANPAELFFDLFFVANLATFTAYHPITGSDSLWSYIGFFTILWSSWFQITLYDVRFARDSFFERVCKTLQMLMFVIFAYIGGKFDPSKNKGEDTFFRTTCCALAFLAFLQGIQYCVVLFYARKNGASQLYTPLIVIISTMFASGTINLVMIPVFNAIVDSHNIELDDVLYGAMVLEVVTVLGVSIYWRTLSFKKTHITERMSLLTLIVIGEGAIGVTKTVNRMMGTQGFVPVDCFMVFCILVILVFIWVLYFDNGSERHFGTIRQQIFCLLHFPLHLCTVAVVEGSQQVALARWTMSGVWTVALSLEKYCLGDNMSGPDIARSMTKDISKFYLESSKNYAYITKALDTVKAADDVCSPRNLHAIDHLMRTLPEPLLELKDAFWGALYSSIGIKLPVTSDVVELALSSWRTVYGYFWTGVIVISFCFILFLALTRRHVHDVFDIFAIGSRVGVAIFAYVMVAVGETNGVFRISFLSSVWVLPTVVMLFSVTIFMDRMGRVVANHRRRKRGVAIISGPMELREQEGDEPVKHKPTVTEYEHSFG